jgi:Winged helix DNA-binding domain
VTSGQGLGRRELNRTLLRRQLLDAPAELSVAAAVEHLVGVQAQLPTAPYIGLWSRLVGFRHDDLADLITERRVVRAALMRSTLHLVTAADCRSLRPAVQQVLDRELANVPAFGPRLAGMDLDTLLDEARAGLRERPMTATELGAHLRKRWPEGDAAAMAYAVRNRETLVQVPPRGLWGKSGLPRHVTAAQWLGDGNDGPDGARSGTEADTRARQEVMILRYLAAFGPATIRDMQAWSGVTGLAEIVEPLRPRLLVRRDDRGRDLWDLPGAPVADADAPAPLRFLPEYDNALLSHADRTRIMPDGVTFSSYWGRLRPRSVVRGGFLADGFLAGLWSIPRESNGRVLSVEPFAALSPADAEAARATGRELLAFVSGDQDGRVELTRADA